MAIPYLLKFLKNLGTAGGPVSLEPPDTQQVGVSDLVASSITSELHGTDTLLHGALGAATRFESPGIQHGETPSETVIPKVIVTKPGVIPKSYSGSTSWRTNIIEVPTQGTFYINPDIHPPHSTIVFENQAEVILPTLNSSSVKGVVYDIVKGDTNTLGIQGYYSVSGYAGFYTAYNTGNIVDYTRESAFIGRYKALEYIPVIGAYYPQNTYPAESYVIDYITNKGFYTTLGSEALVDYYNPGATYSAGAIVVDAVVGILWTALVDIDAKCEVWTAGVTYPTGANVCQNTPPYYWYPAETEIAASDTPPTEPGGENGWGWGDDRFWPYMFPEEWQEYLEPLPNSIENHPSWREAPELYLENSSSWTATAETPGSLYVSPHNNITGISLDSQTEPESVRATCVGFQTSQYSTEPRWLIQNTSNCTISINT